MYARMKRMKKDEKGFTLIELLAVIIIIGIIAAIAVPTIGGLLTKTKEDADKAIAQQLYEAARLKLTAEGKTINGQTVTLKEIQDGGYLPSTVKLASDTTKTLHGDSSKVVFDANGVPTVTLSTDEKGTSDDKVYQGLDFKLQQS